MFTPYVTGFTLQLPSFKEWLILLALSSALAVIFFDSSILPGALPTIQQELVISKEAYPWVINAYFIACGALAIFGGKIGDVLGCKKVFLAGLFFFGLGSWLAFFAKTSATFIIARGIQGSAAAFLTPCAFALLINFFPQKNRGKILGLSVVIGCVFSTCGGALGGVVTEYFSWRVLYFLDFLIVAAGFFLTYKFVSQSTNKIEKIKILHFIDFSLFRRREFSVGTILALCSQFLLMSPIFFSDYFQKTLGYSPTKSGFINMITTIPMFLIPLLGGGLADKWGAKVPIVSGFVLTIFSYGILLIFTHVSSFFLLILSIFLFGIGTSLLMTPIGMMTLGASPEAKRGGAAGIYNTIRIVGAMLACMILKPVGDDNDKDKPYLLFQEAFVPFSRISDTYFSNHFLKERAGRTKLEKKKSLKKITWNDCCQRSNFEWVSVSRLSQVDNQEGDLSIHSFQKNIYAFLSIAFLGLILTLAYLKTYKEKKLGKLDDREMDKENILTDVCN